MKGRRHCNFERCDAGSFALTADSSVTGVGTLTIGTAITVGLASTVTDVFLTGADLVLPGSVTGNPANVIISHPRQLDPESGLRSSFGL